MSFWKKIRKAFVPIRDAVESVASIGGNYLLPGSSLVTSNLVSKGAQKTLNSPLGKIANIAAGATGGGLGESFTGIPSANSIGAGWTGAGNAVGGQFGNPTLGTDISSKLGFGSSTSNAVDSSVGGGGMYEPNLVDANNAITGAGGAASSGVLANIGKLAPYAGAAYAANSLMDGSEPKTAGATSLSGVTPFKATRAGQMEAPNGLAMNGLTSDQQSSSLATQGAYGGGLGKDEQNYFLNLENRKLVDDGGNVADINTLSPIEHSYLQKLGLGGFGNSNDLLKAFSTWKAA